MGVDAMRDRGFFLARLFLAPFLVTSHGLTQTVAAKEIRSVPFFDALTT
jgi:hypothetical protein